MRLQCGAISEGDAFAWEVKSVNVIDLIHNAAFEIVPMWHGNT